MPIPILFPSTYAFLVVLLNLPVLIRIVVVIVVNTVRSCWKIAVARVYRISPLRNLDLIFYNLKLNNLRLLNDSITLVIILVRSIFFKSQPFNRNIKVFSEAWVLFHFMQLINLQLIFDVDLDNVILNLTYHVLYQCSC